MKKNKNNDVIELGKDSYNIKTQSEKDKEKLENTKKQDKNKNIKKQKNTENKKNAVSKENLPTENKTDTKSKKEPKTKEPKNEDTSNTIVTQKLFESKPKKEKKSKKETVILIVVILALIIAICVFFYLFYKEKNKDIPNDYVEDTIEVETEEYNPDDENIIGYLTIEAIDLIDAPIAEGTDEVTVLNYYIGHFEISDYLEGNVALAAHNHGYDNNYFENLKNVEIGDEIIYETTYETKTYSVDTISQILETDIDVVYPSEENKITLITCISGKPTYRLCVIGLETEE